ncbi:hypothetical protein GCM10007175_26280 [Pseudarthrobacter scleromae]|uniref:Uncharacterized protein n=1 Tax=Pseudarthrobacter scleromae TaxID=158897 RepID=A0ABQ2CIU5_9MICC|nr:hypothetical protein GCM10007175_26280 [Pseudarthrobacter scleromae]
MGQGERGGREGGKGKIVGHGGLRAEWFLRPLASAKVTSLTPAACRRRPLPMVPAGQGSRLLDFPATLNKCGEGTGPPKHRKTAAPAERKENQP